MLISIILNSFLLLEAYASNAFYGLETQIHEWSNESKVKKMQLALSEFELYSWDINWNYESVKESLISYQVNTWIDKDLWYFWVKTLTALKEDFPEKFDSVAETYLQMDVPSTEVRKFYVTAYYSPLPDQNRYTTWTYEWDIKLNGGWKRTSSWKNIFTWVVAAPRNYVFWTKIELEWIWVAVVEDRWWAIVNSGERWFEYDRIDIWMWYWDEWLNRALKWWKRTVVWKIVPNTREVSVEFDNSIVSKYSNLKLDAENPKKEDVVDLQNLLTEISVYNWPIDGDFNNVKEVFIKYQVNNNIISSKNDPQAWYFWDKTYAFLRKMFNSWIFKVQKNKLDEDVILSDDMKAKLDKVNIKITNIINKKYWKNTAGALKYRSDLRNVIEKQTYKVRWDIKKNQLKYLRSIL